MIGSMSNILMHHLNIITVKLGHAVLLMNSLNKYGMPMEDQTKGTLACMVKQNIHETHIYPYLSLISELLLQLSGSCSTLHATEWIIDFFPTWEIPSSEYHPMSLGPNICKTCPSSREMQTQNHTTVFLTLPWSVCQVGRYQIIFQRERLYWIVVSVNTIVAQFCLYFTHILWTPQCTLEIHTEPHWQCDRQRCVC